MEKGIERNLGVDLLRIVLMFMIIIHHIMLRGCGLRNLYQNSFDLKNLPFSFINAFLVVAVNCFFLISGYYGMKENLKKEIKLALSVYVMYWLINMAGIISGGQVFNTELIKGFIFPISQYWFIFVYLVLNLIAPYLNILLEHITVRQEQKLLAILLIIWCGYAFLIDNEIFGANMGYSLGFSIILYIVGNYLGRTRFDTIVPGKLLAVYLLASLINALSVIGLICLGKTALAWKLYSYNNPLVLIGAAAFFLMFKNIKIDGKPSIQLIARHVVYVYIFHSTAFISDLYTRYFIAISGSYLGHKIIYIILFSCFLFSVGTAAGIIFEKLYKSAVKIFLVSGK